MRKAKLNAALKKGYATVWDQCLKEITDKLDVWEECKKTQMNQSLHNLITKKDGICMGFNSHKQEIFNPVQGLKMLLLHIQANKESIK